jgi:hypothetical protein
MDVNHFLGGSDSILGSAEQKAALDKLVEVLTT